MQRTTFNKLQPTNSAKQVCILIKNKVTASESKLINAALDPNEQQLSDEHSVVGFIDIPESGDYQFSLQLCLQHDSPGKSCINTLQYGICAHDDMGGGVFESLIVNGNTENGFIICKMMSGFMKMEQGIAYTVWINLNSSANGNYKYIPTMSKLNLYKL